MINKNRILPESILLDYLEKHKNKLYPMQGIYSQEAREDVIKHLKQDE